MTRCYARPALAALPFLLVVAAGASTARAQTPGARAAIEAAVNRIVTAANRLDLEGVLANFTPDAQMLDNASYHRDMAEVRAIYGPAFKGLRSQDIRVERSMVTQLSPTIAVYNASGHFISVDTAGATTPSRAFSWTMVWREEKGTWKATNVHQAIDNGVPDHVAQAAQQARDYVRYAAPDRVPYVPSAPDVAVAVLYGDPGKDAQHGEFTTFTPGFDAGLHSHTNTVTIIVVKGAYLYRDQAGEKRVMPGEFLRIPGGHVHWSGGDAKEGARFYSHMDARMDLVPAKP